MKLKKENVYVSLKGKTKEELTDLWEFLTSNGELTYNKELKTFIVDLHNTSNKYIEYYDYMWIGSDDADEYKREVTIQELKEIIKPMETKFTPIAMKCTQEQFDAIKPKLEKVGKVGNLIFAFDEYKYLTNNYGSILCFDFIKSNDEYHNQHRNNIQEEWNEEIFLKACGIEVETLKEKALRLENELNEVKKQIEEENIKLGNWVHNTVENSFYKIGFRSLTTEAEINQCRKITNPELIKLLEQEIK